jgi:hypothetical protein
VTLTGLQPEHSHYALGWRLFSSGRATWPEIREMSLDDVDLQVLYLDALASAEPASDDGA